MRKKAVLITGVAAAAVVLGGATVAVAAGTQSSGPGVSPGVSLDRSFQVAGGGGPERDDDSNLPALTVEDSDRAANAALAKVGQGRVAEVERENDGGAAYEVEIRLDNGSEVEVQVGADFQVLSQAAPEFDDD
ncbi:PepSY domain-containing protein [Arthrobacter sp. RHLT1-20]